MLSNQSDILEWAVFLVLTQTVDMYQRMLELCAFVLPTEGVGCWPAEGVGCWPAAHRAAS